MQELEFEIADSSNLKKGPIHPNNRPNPNRTKNNQPHRKRNQQKKPRNDHRNSDKNDIRSPKVNSNGERRRRGGPARGKQTRHMNKGENDPRSQPGHPSYKSHPVQEQRPLSSPSPIHQQPDPRQMQQSHSPQPGSAAVQQQQPTSAIVNPQTMGANAAGYGYPLMQQNLQTHQAHLIPSYPPTQSHIPPTAGFVTPNATVPQAQNVLFHTFPAMQAHQLVQQQMFPYQQMQASGMPQQSHMQPPSTGGYASSVSSSAYGSPGPSPAQLSSLQQSGGDELAAVREKYEREIQVLQEQLKGLYVENQALKQLVTNYKATFEQQQSQQFLQMQQQQMQQQQRMQMMQNQQLMQQMQPQMQPQPQIHPQSIPQANQPNQI